MQISATRNKVNKLQSVLLDPKAIGLAEAEPLTRHYFSQGLYCREMAIKAGTIMVGKEHLQDHICIVTKGTCRVVSDEFTGVIEAPYIYASKAGTKRVIFAHTDLVWVTTHATEETDIEVIEQTLVR